MSDKALVPIEQRTVIFYDDEITAVLVDVDGRQVVYVPVRPMCTFLGVQWAAQSKRIRRDAVLSTVAISVSVMDTQGQQRREMGRAIMQMAEEQLQMTQRLNKAAIIVGQHGKRITAIERQLSPRNAITDEQAAGIAEKVKAVAMELTEQDNSKNHFQAIFAELHRRFRVTSYKNIRQEQYQAVLDFLDEWVERMI